MCFEKLMRSLLTRIQNALLSPYIYFIFITKLTLQTKLDQEVISLQVAKVGSINTIIKTYSLIYHIDKLGINFLKSVFDTRLSKTRSNHHVNS